MSIKKWLEVAFIVIVAASVIWWARNARAKAAAQRSQQAETEIAQKQALQTSKAATIRELAEAQNLRLKLIQLHLMISEDIFGHGSSKATMFHRCDMEVPFNAVNQDACAKLDLEAEIKYLKFGGTGL